MPKLYQPVGLWNIDVHEIGTFNALSRWGSLKVTRSRRPGRQTQARY